MRGLRPAGFGAALERAWPGPNGRFLDEGIETRSAQPRWRPGPRVRMDDSSMRGLRLPGDANERFGNIHVRMDDSSMRGLRPGARELRHDPLCPNGRFLDEGIETSAATGIHNRRRPVRMDDSSMRGLRHGRAAGARELRHDVRMDDSSMRGLRHYNTIRGSAADPRSSEWTIPR